MDLRNQVEALLQERTSLCFAAACWRCSSTALALASALAFLAFAWVAAQGLQMAAAARFLASMASRALRFSTCARGACGSSACGARLIG